MAVMQQLRHKLYSSLSQLLVFSSNKSAYILSCACLEFYDNCKSLAAFLGGWHRIFFHSLVSQI